MPRMQQVRRLLDPKLMRLLQAARLQLLEALNSSPCCQAATCCIGQATFDAGQKCGAAAAARCIQEACWSCQAPVALQQHPISCSYSREGSERRSRVPRCWHAPQGFALCVQRSRNQCCRARTMCEGPVPLAGAVKSGAGCKQCI